MNLPHFFISLSFAAIFFLTEKTLATLHFGTRKWTRWLWFFLAVGLCPHFLLAVFWLETAHLRELVFALAAVFFSIKFLEDGDFWDAIFPPIVVAAQCFFGLEIPIFEWVMLAAVALFFFEKRGWPLAQFSTEWAAILTLALLFFVQILRFGFFEKNWGWQRMNPILLPFWPTFGLFMPICLFFLKKTDIAPLPKTWLATASVGSILAAIFWPVTREIGLGLAWLGMIILTFPVFERGLLYGLVFMKKWKVWAVVVGFSLVQVLVFWLKT